MLALGVQQKKHFKEQTCWASLNSDIKGNMIPGVGVDAQVYGPRTSSISDLPGKAIFTVTLLNRALSRGANQHSIHLTP